MKYPVSEIYGPVFQGEGKWIGCLTIFIRFGGCDYRCTWCDSMFAVDPIHKASWTKMTATEIIYKIEVLSGFGVYPSITLSGGNPALYDLTEVVRELTDRGYPVFLETQGSKYQTWFKYLDGITFSPKPPSAGYATPLSEFKEIYEKTLWSAGVDASVKVVISNKEDMDYAVEVAELLRIPEMFIQPCNINREESEEVSVVSDNQLISLRELEEEVVLRGLSQFRVLPQLHVLIHGNERSR